MVLGSIPNVASTMVLLFSVLLSLSVSQNQRISLLAHDTRRRGLPTSSLLLIVKVKRAEFRSVE